MYGSAKAPRIRGTKKFLVVIEYYTSICWFLYQALSQSCAFFRRMGYIMRRSMKKLIGSSSFPAIIKIS
jgi:hypothetical protein